MKRKIIPIIEKEIAKIKKELAIKKLKMLIDTYNDLYKLSQNKKCVKLI